MPALRAVVSLLFSTALLLLGHGMQLTLLPLRADAIGMGEVLIGLSASCYFAGFVVGCIIVPRIIARVGHIRCFAALAAIMIVAVLALELLDHWAFWLVLRLATGIAISGLYSVIESWLNSQASRQNRGQILAVYTFITLISMAAGQLLINIGPASAPEPFILAALFMALAIVPIGLTRRIAPTAVATTRASFRKLYRRSHSAFAGAVLSGAVTGSFWSLGAVFARQADASQLAVTAFMTSAIIGGALFQYPIGLLSDRRDRRQILVLLALANSVASIAVALSAGHAAFLFTVVLFGATIMPMYAVSLATAADVSSSEEFVEIGTSVLLLNGCGAILAPIILGQCMAIWGANSLFWGFAVVCLVFAGLFLKFMREPRAVSTGEQTHFAAAASEAAPASFELDPRGEAEDTAAAGGGAENPVAADRAEAEQSPQ
ncbi:MFS transporter [Haliea sp. E17]|uniref:MFS transporter n=1 Tax=Haliea sp. E17 TaxID=3401576 RepID=UPI003AAB45C4